MKVWQANAASGFDTGELEFSFHCEKGGGENGVIWTVEGGATVPMYSGVTYAQIMYVKLRVAVQAAGLSVEMSDVVMTSFRNGLQVDEIEFEEQYLASTLGKETVVFDEVIMDLESDASNVDAIVITGMLRLRGRAGVYPASNDLVAEMFLFAADCTT